MNIRDGDIFRWRYKDETPEQRRPWGRYHCRSQIAVAKGGWLIDTFWTYRLENPRRDDNTASWPYADAAKNLDLTPLGNLADLDKKPEYEGRYYDDADCVNLNHSNSSGGNFYIRKGAQRSRDKMRAFIEGRIKESQSAVEYAQRRLAADQEKLAALDAGASLEEMYL